MLCHHNYYHHASSTAIHGGVQTNANPNPFPLSTTLHFPAPHPLRPLLLSSSSATTATFFQSQEGQRPILTKETSIEGEEKEESLEDEEIGPPWKQNAKSTAFLRLLESEDETVEENKSELDKTVEGGGGDEEEEKKKRMLEELSLISRRRNPRFPGAIDYPKPGDSVGSLVKEDDRALRHALEIRRGVAAEVLKVAMRASRLSINYSNNLVFHLPDFVDLVIIEAAAMKGDTEFSHLSFNARAKIYIQNSGIVPLIKWLKHNSMSYPQMGKLICMCPRNLELLRHTVEWLKSIYVRGGFLGSVLVKAGAIWERGMEELNELIRYLEKSGVGRDWMGFVVSRCPKVLSLSMEELEERVKFYMEMGMSEKDFGTMVFDYPKALGFFSLEEMNCKANYLKEFGLSTHDVGRLLAYKPQLMGCSIEERWKPLVKYLYYLGVRRDGMRRILVMKPMVFCVDLETTIAPKVRFLQDIGIREEVIGAVLVKFPSLLTYSLYKKIRPVVIFLMSRAGVTERDIGKVIALEPELVGCSIVHKLDINVKYFLSLGIRVQSLGEMIADFPMLLKYNLDVLRPKYRYLRRVMVRPLQDLIEFPRFFSYSLEGRIIPRHKVLVEKRINFKLRYMLAGSDREFDERVKAAIEKRRRFESGINEDDLQLHPSSNASLDASDSGLEIGLSFSSQTNIEKMDIGKRVPEY